MRADVPYCDFTNVELLNEAVRLDDQAAGRRKREEALLDDYRAERRARIHDEECKALVFSEIIKRQKNGGKPAFKGVK